MKKQNKWTIAIVSALIGIGACTTSVQAVDTTSDVSTNQSTSATTSYSKADYFSRNPKIIRVKHSIPAYSDAALTNSVRTARSGEHFLVQSLITLNCKAPVVRTTTGLYLPAKTSLLAAVKGYQNPKGYHQVHYTQVKPYGTVGYNLYRGYEGIKTWRVMHRLGTWADKHLKRVPYSGANVVILSFTTNQVRTPSGTLQSTLATIALSRVGHHA